MPFIDFPDGTFSMKAFATLPNGHEAILAVWGKQATKVAALDLVAHLTEFFDFLNNDTVSPGGPGWKDNLSSEVTFTKMVARAEDDPVGPEIIQSISVTGSNSGSQPLPAQVAAVVTLRTAKRGRSFRGRIYAFGFTEATNQADATIEAIVAQNLTDRLEGLNAGLQAEAVSATIVVASRKLASVEPVVTFDTNTAWDTQRRRSHP
jgi:hypothetical protein